MVKRREKNKAKPAKSASASRFENELLSHPPRAVRLGLSNELAGKQLAEAVAFLEGRVLKWPGRPKGKQQTETVDRIGDAAALVFLKYSQPRMAPLLYPTQPDPEEGRKTVNRFLNRNKTAIMHEVKAMTREQAEQIAKSLPRDKN